MPRGLLEAHATERRRCWRSRSTRKSKPASSWLISAAMFPRSSRTPPKGRGGVVREGREESPAAHQVRLNRLSFLRPLNVCAHRMPRAWVGPHLLLERQAALPRRRISTGTPRECLSRRDQAPGRDEAPRRGGRTPYDRLLSRMRTGSVRRTSGATPRRERPGRTLHFTGMPVRRRLPNGCAHLWDVSPASESLDGPLIKRAWRRPRGPSTD